MLKRAVTVLSLAFLFGYTDLVPTLRILLLPPHLPLHHASLPTSNPLQSFTVHSRSSDSSPLKFCEDATPFGDQVILSCDPHRKDWNTVMGPLRNTSAGMGSLWIVDPAAEKPKPKQVELRGYPEQADFHPLGIEVEGERLFVVNHQREESTIELFRLSSSSNPPQAIYLATLRHPSFTGAPNSIAVLSSTSFYLTHDHHYTRRSKNLFGKIMNLVETLGRRQLSRVDLVSFSLGDSTSTTAAEVHIAVATVAKDIAFANGAALSHDKKTLAIASTSGRSLLLYSRDPSNNTLSLREEIHLPFFVDNLSLAPKNFFPTPSLPSSLPLDAEQDDEPSTFIAAGHPAYLPLLATSRGANLSRNARQAGSWVLAISPRRSTFPRDSLSSGSIKTDEPAYNHVPHHECYELVTLFQSNGGSQYDEQAFGMSTTGVVGVAENGRKWLSVVGLYERGLRVVRELS